MPKHHTKQEVIEAIDNFAANAELTADKVKTSLRDFITHAENSLKKLGGEVKAETAKVEKKLTGAAATAAAKKAETAAPAAKVETPPAAKTEEAAAEKPPAEETGEGKDAA